MKAVLYIIILLSYILAPREYSWGFCACMLTLFGLVFLNIIVKAKDYKIIQLRHSVLCDAFFCEFCLSGIHISHGPYVYPAIQILVFSGIY